MKPLRGSRVDAQVLLNTICSIRVSVRQWSSPSLTLTASLHGPGSDPGLEHWGSLKIPSVGTLDSQTGIKPHQWGEKPRETLIQPKGKLSMWSEQLGQRGSSGPGVTSPSCGPTFCWGGGMMCPRVSHSPLSLGTAPSQPSSPSLTGHRAVLHDGALAPGQGVLEGLEEVKDAPANDDVVVEANKKTHLGGEEKGGHNIKPQSNDTVPRAPPPALLESDPSPNQPWSCKNTPLTS